MLSHDVMRMEGRAGVGRRRPSVVDFAAPGIATREASMILGMFSLSAYTIIHVIISLIAHRDGLRRHVRHARRQAARQLDLLISSVHDADQRDRLRLSVRRRHAGHHRRRHVAGRRWWSRCSRSTASTSPAPGAGSMSSPRSCAVVQRVRADRAGVPEDRGAQGAGADAIGAAVPIAQVVALVLFVVLAICAVRKFQPAAA